MIFKIVLCIFVVSLSHINAQLCTTPKNEDGQCISVYQCEPLVAMLLNKNRTPQDHQFLKDSKCGFDKNTPLVCCPQKSCQTQEGKPGKCIGVESCPHLKEMLLHNETQGNLDYVRRSRCQGPAAYSVCCGPPSNAKEETTFIHPCQKHMTTFPPERDSECCGVESTSADKIVGGTETGIDYYPWLVVIEYIKLGVTKLFCGGALISGKYVLTAGHCVAGQILDYGTPKFVRLGEYNTSNSGPDCIQVPGGGIDCTDPVTIIPIEKTIPHPDYKPFHPQRRNDIALVRLKTIPRYTDFIRPICLPSQDYTITTPSPFDLYVAGWGRHIQYDNGTNLSSKVKLHVDLPYVGREKCQEAQRSLREGANLVLWEGQMCAGGVLGKDSCKGDSGGPLMYQQYRQYEAVGLVSFGPEKCGQMNIPGVYTHVYQYLPWIKSNIVA